MSTNKRRRGALSRAPVDGTGQSVWTTSFFSGSADCATSGDAGGAAAGGDAAATTVVAVDVDITAAGTAPFPELPAPWRWARVQPKTTTQPIRPVPREACSRCRFMSSPLSGELIQTERQGAQAEGESGASPRFVIGCAEVRTCE